MTIQEATNGLYNTFRFLHSLNNVEQDKEVKINELDMNIIKAHHNVLKKKIGIDFDVYMGIVKKLSYEYMKVPVVISNIIYKKLK